MHADLMKRSLLSLALALILAQTAHAALVPGSESPVTTAQLDVAAFDQSNGRIASDGTSFFAVWKDVHPYSGAEVRGSAITAEGARVHDLPIEIAGAAASDDAPAIAFGGGRYLVAWSTAGSPAEMKARFVTSDGTLSPTLTLGISTGSARPQIAFNGNVFLVLWTAPQLKLRGAIVTTAGTIATTFDAGTAELTYPEIPLVATGTTFRFVTAKIDQNGTPGSNGFPSSVHVTPIAEDGTVGNPITIAPAISPVFHLRADARGPEMVVAWSTAIGIPGNVISSVLITSLGPSAVDTFEANLLQLYDIVADSSGYLFVYGDDDSHFTRAAGTDVQTPLALPPGLSSIDDAISNGTRTLLLTRGLARFGDTHGPAGSDLYVQRLDNAPLVPLAVAPRHQVFPDLAAAGDMRLAAWSEYVGSERRVSIVAARLDANGASLDPNGIDFGIDTDFAIPPRVASDGTNWLVVWREGTNVLGTRVARNGTLMDATPFVVASDVYDSTDVAVSWDGAQYVVVFARGMFLRGLQTRIMAARVLSNGAVQSPEIALSDTNAHEAAVIASSPENGSLVVWRTGIRINGAMLSRGGTPSPVAFPAVFVVSPRPGAGWNGSFLAASPYIGPFGSQVQWHLVNALGTVTTPSTGFVSIAATGFGWASLEVEPSGDGYLLYAAGHATENVTHTTGLYVSKISSSGALVDGPAFVSSAVADFAPAIGASGASVAYARNIGHPVRQLARVFVRSIVETPREPKRRAVRK